MGIIVLSLFDGISCGMVALERAGIKVDRYVAYEIDENAIAVSQNNYPKIEHCGDVVNADFTKYEGFDLLIGGSPCQDLCGMGSRKGLDGEKSKLFFEYVRALKEVNPKYFLLENNASMTKQNRDIISSLLGVEPTMIDSAFFSAQIRKRLYWTNIPIEKYFDQNIYLKDIVDMSNVNRNDVTDKINKYVFGHKYDGRKIQKTTKSSIRNLKEKSRTIGCYSYDIASNTGISLKIGDRYYQPTQKEFELLQTLPEGYTSCLPIKKAVFAIGNGWTVDVIAHIFKGLKENKMGLIDKIKQNALENGSAIQSTEGSKLDAILNKMFYLEKDIDEETKFVHDVMTRGLESQERVGLHASAIIDKGEDSFCIRQQVLSLVYKQLQGEQLPADLMRIFEEGNAVHEKWQRLFIRAGYAKAKTCDRTRFDSEYMLSYTPDIVVRIPEFYKGAMVVEIKSMNSFSFQKQFEHVSGHKQLQLYMYLLQKAKGNLNDPNDLDYKKGFTLLDSKNDQKFRTVLYDYEPETVAPFIDRLDDIYVAHQKFLEEKVMPKKLKACTSVDCKYAEKCMMRDACYNINNGRVRIGE